MLNKINTRLKVDLYSSSQYTVVNTQQGDNNSRIIEVELLDNGNPYVLPEKVTISLQGARPDGFSILESCQYSGNIITCELKDYILAVEGKCSVKIVLLDSDMILSSIPFHILVGKNPFDEKGVIGTPQFSILTEAIRAANEALEKATQVNNSWAEQSVDINSQWISQKEAIQTEWEVKKDEVTEATNAANKAKENANTAASNANIEIEKMKALEDSVETAEFSRVIAEQGRVGAEIERVAEESNRNINESKRMETESARDVAETTRGNAEQIRIQNEIDRINTESTRVESENKRVDAELDRTDNENIRQLNEDNRINAEQKRNIAETERVDNENKRKANEINRQQAETKRESDFLSAKTAAETATTNASKAADRANNAAEVCEDLVAGVLPIANEYVAGAVKATDDLHIASDGKTSIPILYSQIATAEESFLSLSTLNGGLRVNEIRGKTIQTGKNLVDINSMKGSNVIKGNSITINAENGKAGVSCVQKAFLKAGTYAMSTKSVTITGTGVTARTGIFKVDFYDEDSKYFKYDLEPNLRKKTFTLDKDLIVNITLMISGDEPVSDVSVTWDEVMLEPGSTKTEYEPYIGGFPSPELPIPIKGVGESGSLTLTVNGKNLFPQINSQTFNGVTFAVTTDGTITLSGTATANSTLGVPYNKFLPSGTYTLSANNNQVMGANVQLKLCYSSSGGIYKNVMTQLSAINKTQTYTIDGGFPAFAHIYIASGTVLNNLVIKPQLESGTATPFEQYKETKATITLSQPLRRVGNVYDRIVKRNGIWGIERNIAKVIYNGSSDYALSGIDSTSLADVVKFAIVGILPNAKAVNDIKVFVDKFEVKSTTDNSNTEHARNSDPRYGDQLLIYIAKTRLNEFTSATIRAWFATNPITILYQLEVPVFEPLPTAEQAQLNALQTFSGVTNVFTDDALNPTLNVSYGKTDVAALELYTSNQGDSKINKTDIVNNLATTVKGKVLGAEQGTELQNQITELDKELSRKSPSDHKHTKSQITDFPTSMPADGGNADTLEGKHSNEFVNWIGRVTPKIANDPTYPINYQGDIMDSDASAVGLPSGIWWHVSYQRHSVNTSGFGLLIAYPLNNSKEKPRYRTAQNGKTWEEWSVIGDSNVNTMGITKQFTTEAEANDYIDNFSSLMSDYTYYRLVVDFTFSHSKLGGGTYYIDGFKTWSGYEWQKAYSYEAELPRTLTRTKFQGMWKGWAKTNDGGNANTLGGLDNNKFVQWIGTVNLTTLNDSAIPLNYEGDVEPTTAKSIGLAENWWHVKYQRHANTAGGYGLQQFFPLNAPSLSPRYRTSSSKTWETPKPMGGDLIFRSVVVNTGLWNSDNQFSSFGYNFKAVVSCPGALETQTPMVTFAPAQSLDDNIGSIIYSVNNGIWIYARTKPTANITINEIRFLPN